MYRSGAARYFIADHLGSTNGLATPGGGLSASIVYDGYGNTVTSIPTRYRYTGREYDSFTGLYYYRARWYDAQIGRFISEDPIGFAGGDVNMYGYVKNNPLNKKDPLGLQDTDTIILNSPPFSTPPPPTSRLGAKEMGFQAESRNFPKTGLPNDPNIDPYSGGYRHCVSACVLGKRYGIAGRIIVYFWDFYHENPNDPTGESQGDMRAEQDGLSCAYESNGDETACEVQCLTKYPRQ